MLSSSTKPNRGPATPRMVDNRDLGAQWHLEASRALLGKQVGWPAGMSPQLVAGAPSPVIGRRQRRLSAPPSYVSSPKRVRFSLTEEQPVKSPRSQRQEVENTPTFKSPILKRQSMPSQAVLSPNTKRLLNPIFSGGSGYISYDVRCPPTMLQFPPGSPWHKHPHSALDVPLTPENSSHACLVSGEFPWILYVDMPQGLPATCLEIVHLLYHGLQRPVTPSEWRLASERERTRMLRARDRRVAAGVDADPTLKRVDWLGSRIMFYGLERSETQALGWLLPGTQPSSETWTVRLGRADALY